MTTNEPGHVGPHIEPRWLDIARQVIIFLLGVAVLVLAVRSDELDIALCVVGLILLGLIPLERGLLRQWRTRSAPDTAISTED